MTHEYTPDPLADFDIHTVAYKKIAGHDVLADISFPKDLEPGLHPVVVNWHGGALVTGSRNFRPFYPPWLEPFARRNSAIVISPDYRLLPESKVLEITEDIASFWDWLHSSAPKTIQEISHGEHRADLSRLILNGGSAGGWCALLQALDHPDEIRAVMVQYPGVGLDDIDCDPNDPKNADKKMIGMQVWLKEQLDEHLRTLAYGTPVSEGGFDRIEMAFSAKAWGRLGQWKTEIAQPAQRVKEGRGLPPKLYLFPLAPSNLTNSSSWLIHGREDSVVDISSSEQFVRLVREFCPETDLRVEYFAGEHGFDNRINANELQGGLDWIQDAW